MNGANQSAVANIHANERGAMRDSEIIAAAQAGSPEAFADLHAIYSPRLYRTILGITKSPEDAEDALQDTFFRASLKIRTFEGRSSIYSWLTRIAINSALMILRKRRARAEILFGSRGDDPAEIFCDDIKDSSPSPEQACSLNQIELRLQRTIRTLDPQLRKPFQMRLLNGTPLKEIGQGLKISEGAVKARLYRARVRLSAAWQRSGYRCQDAVPELHLHRLPRTHDLNTHPATQCK
jgi:RNA polymerase sigma-70 factor (ECF subfamily)